MGDQRKRQDLSHLVHSKKKRSGINATAFVAASGVFALHAFPARISLNPHLPHFVFWPPVLLLCSPLPATGSDPQGLCISLLDSECSSRASRYGAGTLAALRPL